MKNMTWFADKEDGHNPLDNNGNDPNNHDDKGPGCSTIIAIAVLLLLGAMALGGSIVDGMQSLNIL